MSRTGRCRRRLRRDRNTRHSQASRNPFHAGHVLFGASRVTHLRRLSRLLVPAGRIDRCRAYELLNYPASNGSSPSPCWYKSTSDWTPLLAGLCTRGMAASLAAPHPAAPFETGVRVVIPVGASLRRGARHAEPPKRSLTNPHASSLWTSEAFASAWTRACTPGGNQCTPLHDLAELGR